MKPEQALSPQSRIRRQWEAFALPDWPAYIDFGMRLPPGKDGFWSCAACAADRSTLERYLEALPSIGTKVNMTTLQWSQLTPWQATYWKTLPTGHRVKFKAQESEEILDWSEIPYTDHRTLHPRWYRWD